MLALQCRSLTELDITLGLCIPRISYQALPSLHPGLCRSVVPTALAISLIRNALTFGKNSKYLSSLIPAYTPLNACMRVSFCKLQLKSVQTTAEVCTDYTCSLHRLRRGFNFRKGRGYFLFVNGTVSMCIDGEII